MVSRLHLLELHIAQLSRISAHDEKELRRQKSDESHMFITRLKSERERESGNGMRETVCVCVRAVCGMAYCMQGAQVLITACGRCPLV